MQLDVRARVHHTPPAARPAAARRRPAAARTLALANAA